MSDRANVESIARRFSESSIPGLDRLPKYLRLSNVMLDAIVSGEFRPGSRIPGERDLTDVLPLSLGTIQRAMNDLVDQGVVFRRAGRGTFVAGVTPASGHAAIDKVARQDLFHFRFSEDGSDQLLPVYLQVDAIDKVARTGSESAMPWEDFLEEGNAFVRIDRRLNVGDLFSGYCRFYLPGRRYASLLRRSPKELNGVTLREFLNQTYNMPTLRFEHRILSGQLPEEICSKLGLKPPAYGTLWHIYGRSYRDIPASYQVVYLPEGHRPIELLEKLE